MTGSEHSYTLLGLLLLAGLLFCLGPLLLARLWAWWFSPPKPGADKQAAYECGVESRGDAWVQFRPEYYRYALLFLIFDVEVVFLFPFAAAFTGLSLGAIAAMGLFLLLLVEGWLWAWQKGLLDWQ